MNKVRKQTFSYDYILSLIGEQKLSKGDHVTLSGGEPSLYEYIYDLIGMLSAKGVRITLLTNCSGFVDPVKAHRLSDVSDKSHFDVVTAIHSANAKIHDWMTGTLGSFEQSLKGLHNLLDVGVNITIKHIITAPTYKMLPELAKMIRQTFPPSIEVQFTSADYSGNARTNARELAITFEETQPKLEETLDILIKQCRIPYKVSMIEMPLCSCNTKYWPYFRQTGKKLDIYIAPNVANQIGIVHKVPNDCAPIYLECKSCDVQCFCPGIWKTAYELIGKSLLRPIKCVLMDL